MCIQTLKDDVYTLFLFYSKTGVYFLKEYHGLNYRHLAFPVYLVFLANVVGVYLLGFCPCKKDVIRNDIIAMAL